jgi:O-antigen ligase
MSYLDKEYPLWNKAGQEWAAVVCCLGMIAGLIFSRALLSMSMIALFVNALHPQTIKHCWQRWKSNVFTLLSLSFFLIYLVSGLWSEDKDFWSASTINKLPFVILPFAFFSVPFHKEKFRRIIIAGLVLMQLTVVIYSMSLFLLHPEYYINGYSFSQPLPTTKYNDHIRFSLSLVLSILMSSYLLFEKKTEPLPAWLKIMLCLSILIFAAYIHILAAKTGIVCLYLMVLLYIIGKTFRRNKMLSLALVLVVCTFPVVAYYALPTFRMKIGYVFYEVKKSMEDKKYDYTLSDAGRMITYDIGAKLIARNPVIGVGAGDVMNEVRKGYQKDYPEVAANQQYGPTNQFMFTILAVGVPLGIFLIGMVWSPFVLKGMENRIYLWITSFLMIVSMLVEAMLELQFGVFLYLFFTLFWIVALKKEEKVAPPVSFS